MALHRFYLGDGALAGVALGDELPLAGEPAHRIGRVLRLRPGERILLAGDGREFEAELVEAGARISVRLASELLAEAPRRSLTLYQALIRPNRFEWLIEKAAEIGVAAIVPVVSEHTTVRATEIGAARLERWRRIAIEAMEQCGRRQPPAILPPLDFATALGEAPGLLVFAWEELRGQAVTPIVRDALSPGGGHNLPPISLFVGPEGGWSASEVDEARTAGAALLSLGPNILRAETAAIVASALLLLG